MYYDIYYDIYERGDNMNLKNWRENLNKVQKAGNSLIVVIPFNIRNDMELEEGDYLYSVYDDKNKSITFSKHNKEV
jgi:hypothetical protein